MDHHQTISLEEKHDLLLLGSDSRTRLDTISRPSQPAQALTAGARKPTSARLLSLLWPCLIIATLLVVHALQKPTSHYLRRHRERCSKSMTAEQCARRILAHNPLIDGHVDLAVLLRLAYRNRIDNDAWRQAFENGSLPGSVDLFRLRKGQSGGAFWSVFAPCPSKGNDSSDANLAASVQYTLDQIDVMERLMGTYPHHFAPGLESRHARGAFDSGKLISPLGVEGLHQIGNSAANLRRFYQLGARYVTLTHNCHNKFADAALLEHPMRKAEPRWHGISPLGRRLIHEMNRIGMIVDLSHVSEETMFDVLGGRDGWSGSKAPIIFSHSSAFALCPHPRNVKDYILRMVKERNSVVLVNVNPEFISCVDNGNPNGLPDKDDAHVNLERIVQHILHIGKLIGFDHVGIGTDFDGIESTPDGFQDVTNYPDLIAALLRAGVSESDAAKVAGGNLLRVWHNVDAVSAKMIQSRAPVMEDNLESL